MLTSESDPVYLEKPGLNAENQMGRDPIILDPFTAVPRRNSLLSSREDGKKVNGKPTSSAVPGHRDSYQQPPQVQTSVDGLAGFRPVDLFLAVLCLMIVVMVGVICYSAKFS